MSLLYNARSRLAEIINPSRRTITMGMGNTPSYYTHMLARLAREFNATPRGLAEAAEISTWIALALEERGRAVSRMPWAIMNRATGEETRNHAFHRMVQYMYLKFNRSFFYTWVVSELVHGESPFLKLYNTLTGTRYQAGGLQWLNPIGLRAWIDQDQIEYWEYTSSSGRTLYYRPEDLFIPQRASLIDDLRGQSAVARALQDAEVEESIKAFLKAYFDNDAAVGGILTARQGVNLTETESKRAIAQFRKQTDGPRNSFRHILIPYGFEYKPNTAPALPQTNELDSAQRDKILAPLRVHPALVGAHTVDPLSANATLRAVKGMLYENVVIPDCDQIEEYINAVIMPWIDPSGLYVFEWDYTEIMSLIEQTREKTDQVVAQWAGGAINRNEMREALGYKPIPGGDHWVAAPGSPILISAADMGNAGQITAPIPPAATPFGAALPAGEPPATAALPTPSQPQQPILPAGEPQATKVYVMLRLGAVPALVELQDEVRSLHDNRYPTATATWEDPSDFHVTLVGIPLASERSVRAMCDAIGMLEDLPDLDLSVGSLTRFDKLERNPIHFLVKKDEDLAALQAMLYDIAEECGCECNDYSQPESWTPHITMGYSTARLRRTSNRNKRSVKPRSIAVSIDHKTVYERALIAPGSESPPAPQTQDEEAPDPRAELRAWKRRATGKNARRAVDFVTEAIPVDVARVVRWSLRLGIDLNSAFAVAGEMLAGTYSASEQPVAHIRMWEDCGCDECSAIRAKKPPTVAELQEAIRPEAMDYWKHYDDLGEEIANVWLKDYMQAAWKRLDGKVKENVTPEFDVLDALENLEDELLDGWIGKPDDLGPLPKLILAGMAAGTSAIVSGMPAAPRAALRDLVGTIKWDQMSEQAYEFAKSYLPTLIRDINEHTQEQVRNLIAAWIESGDPLSVLRAQLNDIFQDEKRADKIAQTESVRVFQAGAESRYRTAGIKRIVSQTVRDSEVCPICRPLHGKKASIDTGFDTGPRANKKPPYHVKCRCYTIPDAGSLDELDFGELAA